MRKILFILVKYHKDLKIKEFNKLSGVRELQDKFFHPVYSE